MDDEIKDEEELVDVPVGEEKKKGLLDDVESLDDAADDELAVDKEDLMDDVEEM